MDSTLHSLQVGKIYVGIWVEFTIDHSCHSTVLYVPICRRSSSWTHVDAKSIWCVDPFWQSSGIKKMPMAPASLSFYHEIFHGGLFRFRVCEAGSYRVNTFWDITDLHDLRKFELNRAPKPCLEPLTPPCELSSCTINADHIVIYNQPDSATFYEKSPI
jgi:hypothetical protein